MRPGVVADDAKSGLAPIVGLEAQVHSVIVRVTLRAAVVHRGELTVGPSVARPAAGVGGNERIAKIDLGSAEFVDVIDVVQVNAMCSVVLDGEYGIAAYLALERKTPELGLRRADVLVNLPRANRRKRYVARAFSERTKVAARNRHTLKLDRGIVRRVLNHVESDVSEVALVGDSVTATKAGPAVTEDVPGEADA